MKQETTDKALTMFEEQRNYVTFLRDHRQQLKQAQKENEAAAALSRLKVTRLRYLWFVNQAEQNIRELMKSPDHRDFQVFMQKAFADQAIRFTDTNEASGFPRKQLKWRESKMRDTKLLGETVRASTKILVGKESDYETHVMGLVVAREHEISTVSPAEELIDGKPITSSGHVIMIMTEVGGPFTKPTEKSIAASLRVGILKRTNEALIGGYKFSKYDQNSPIIRHMYPFLINLCIPELTMSILFDSFLDAVR